MPCANWAPHSTPIAPHIIKSTCDCNIVNCSGQAAKIAALVKKMLPRCQNSGFADDFCAQGLDSRQGVEVLVHAAIELFVDERAQHEIVAASLQEPCGQ